MGYNIQMIFEPVIGLEVHVQLNTKSKMFCSCSANYQEHEPNSLVCQVCLGLPGTLPSVNKEALISAIKLGLALNCNISNLTKFDRKNYVYPDLMKGYQITQVDLPIAVDGTIMVNDSINPEKSIRINRVHMEEDVAKLSHNEINKSVIMDVNRSGVPLLEVVTEPDFSTSGQAEYYLTQLQSIVRYLEIGTANMEEGSFRCDANVSIREKGSKLLNEKVEIKNMNRVKAVARAIEYEVKRQEEAFLNGERIIQETRGWDDVDSVSIPQRSKEDAHDYRYFPEPDLPVINISNLFVQNIKEKMPELPNSRLERYINDLGLTEYDATVLINNMKKSIFFEEVISINYNNLDPKYIASWVNVELSSVSNKKRDLDLKDMNITAKNFAKLISLVNEKKINKNSAKDLLNDLYSNNQDPEKLSNERGLLIIEDNNKLRNIVEKVIANNQSAIDDYNKGKETAVRFLIGQVMKESRGTANPKSAEEEILNVLKND